jgi:hypothetical protein
MIFKVKIQDLVFIVVPGNDLAKGFVLEARASFRMQTQDHRSDDADACALFPS